MKRGQGQAGWKLMHDLHDFAKQVFKGEDPRLIGVLITMARTPLSEFPGLYGRVWEYFARLANIIYQSDHHPIAVLCHFLGPTDHTSKELLFRQNSDIFRQHLGGTHDKTIRTKLNLCDFLLDGYERKPEVRSMLEETVRNCKQNYDEKDILVRTALYCTAWIYKGQENYESAEAIYRDIMRRNDEAVRETSADRITIRIPVRLEAMVEKRGRLLESERLLVQALRNSIKKCVLRDYENVGGY
jgi:hypothetical protein